jgi:hypothetical protein
MAKRYLSPVILDDTPGTPGQTLEGDIASVRDLKEDMSTSFVYGDDSYEEEYVVPDVIQEVASADPVAEDSEE